MTPSPTPQRLTPAELREIAATTLPLSELAKERLRAHAAYLETLEWQDAPLCVSCGRKAEKCEGC
jgi:hypothetical protein